MRSELRLALLATVAGLLVVDGAHAFVDVPLEGAGFGLVRSASRLGAAFSFTASEGLRGFDPSCPVGSWLILATSRGRWEVPLACERWLRTPQGHRYAGRDATGSLLRLVIRRDRLRIQVARSPASWFENASSVEVSVEVGATRYCGRFEGTPRTRAGVWLSRGPSRACAARPPPNFVLVNLDDTRFDGVDRMPVVLDRIAAQGVRFTNAFTPSAVCTPSRASLLTGRYAVHHGTRWVGGPNGGANSFRNSGADRQTIAVWLQAAGYRTGLFGKYLNAYNRASEGDKGPDGSFYVPPGWDRFWGMLSPEHYGGTFGGSYTIVEESGELNVFDRHADDSQYSTNVSGNQMREFIAAAVEAGRPFFAYWAPYASHVETPSFVPTPLVRHVYSFANLEPWRPPSWNEADVSDKPRWVRESDNGDQSIWLTDIQRMMAYSTLLAVDEELGLLLDQLAALGVDEDTVVILTSDNGVTWGEHRLFVQGKGCPYEECQRAPMIVRYPRRIREPGSAVAAPVLNIDLAPTLAALAGFAPPVAIDGVSFEGWLVGSPSRSWRSDYLIETGRARAPSYFGVRDVGAGYTWVEYASGERELYDLEEDPHQLENRADVPALGEIRRGLETRLRELLEPFEG